MRRNYNNNHMTPSAADRAQWKMERLAMIGQLITTNTTDAILQCGIVTEHIDGSCYKVLANGQELFASHNKKSNLWKLWNNQR
jgi:hypothetical protein